MRITTELEKPSSEVVGLENTAEVEDLAEKNDGLGNFCLPGRRLTLIEEGQFQYTFVAQEDLSETMYRYKGEIIDTETFLLNASRKEIAEVFRGAMWCEDDTLFSKNPEKHEAIAEKFRDNIAELTKETEMILSGEIQHTFGSFEDLGMRRFPAAVIASGGEWHGQTRWHPGDRERYAGIPESLEVGIPTIAEGEFAGTSLAFQNISGIRISHRGKSLSLPEYFEEANPEEIKSDFNKTAWSSEDTVFDSNSSINNRIKDRLASIVPPVEVNPVPADESRWSFRSAVMRSGYAWTGKYEWLEG